MVPVNVHGQEFSELKIPYNTVVAVDYANLESIGKISYCLRKEETVTAYKNTALNVCWDIANIMPLGKENKNCI